MIVVVEQDMLVSDSRHQRLFYAVEKAGSDSARLASMSDPFTTTVRIYDSQ
jgi:hypothetical protein